VINNRQLEKKRWNGYTWNDVIELLNIHLSKCDYMTVMELDKKISTILNIPKAYVTKVRLSTFKLPHNIKWESEKFLIENAFEYKFPDTFFGPFMLECTNPNCYELQEYISKSGLLRVLGFEHDAYNTTKKENKGTCGICSRSADREGWSLSEEYAKNRRLNAYNYAHSTNFKSVEELPDRDEYKQYRSTVDNMSRTNLKKEKSELYKLWNENTWDGVDITKLTIEHKRPVSICFQLKIPVEEVAHINNLEVISMKDNLKKWEKYNHSIKVKQKLIGKSKFYEKLNENNDWAWDKDYSSVQLPSRPKRIKKW